MKENCQFRTFPTFPGHSQKQNIMKNFTNQFRVDLFLMKFKFKCNLKR